MVWKLQYYGFFSENYYDIVIPFVFRGDLVVECYQLNDTDKTEWIGWVTKEIQAGINAKEPPIKFYINQKRYIDAGSKFPYKLIVKNNNYSVANIHLKIHEWIPLEFINSQEVQVQDWMLIIPERNLRINWYIENKGDNPIVLKWGSDGNEWKLKPGQFISGERGKNKDLYARSLLGSLLNFIENWEE